MARILRLFTGLLVVVFAFLTLVYLFLPFSIISEPADKLFVSPRHKIKPNTSIPISTIPDYCPPLRTSGTNIIDSDGKVVRLHSINWYGASDIDFIPSGLDTEHRDNISILIRRMGFNSVRLPYADEMVREDPIITPEKLAANPDLIGKTALGVFHAVIESMTKHGLFVIPNNHITQATWCCGANLCDAQWRNDWLGPLCRVRQSEAQWIENWKQVMKPLADNRLVIGADLRNEVRAPWGTLRWETWAAAAERCSEHLLDINPEWLMIVEGLSSANDLSGVRNRPVKLSIDNKVVYSCHIYAWSGWGELKPYSKASYEHFAQAMKRNWAYLLEEDIAPVWVGEFGTSDVPTKGDRNYWTHLIKFLRHLGVGFGYWAINPRKPLNNEYESYGMVDDAWQKVVWDYRLEDLRLLGLNTSLLGESV
jgi:aryl-phospho-beta-D-glucosidase BglC (GH1 family)